LLQREKLYIPHGSDESASLIAFARLSKSFISHMVQMKVISSFGGTSMFALYIPHGSDERKVEKQNKSDKILFISHMVQMKAGIGTC